MMEKPNFMSGENYESDNYDAGFNKCKLEYDTYLSSIADVERIGTIIHTTKAWLSLHTEVRLVILADVRNQLATAISDHIKGNK